MNKPVAGVLLGGALGVLDGATAWFTPAVRPAIMAILIGSSVKGMVVGMLSGLIARKVKSIPIGIASGAVIGLALAYLAAAMPQPDGQHYYIQIMTPGVVVGAIIGFLTQQMSTTPTRASYGENAQSKTDSL